MDMSVSKLREMVKDKEAWWAAIRGVEELDTSEWLNTIPFPGDLSNPGIKPREVLGVAKSQTQLSDWTELNNCIIQTLIETFHVIEKYLMSYMCLKRTCFLYFC